MTVSLGEEQRPAAAVASPPSETRPFGRWGGPALFLAALFLATLGSRDVLLLPLVAKFLGPEGMGRVVGTATMFPNLLVLPLAFLSDRVPRRESRRRLYLLLAGVMSVGAWASIPFVPLGPGPMTVIAVILGCATAAIVVSARGALVESARPLAATGRLAAGLVAAQAAAMLFQRPIQQHLLERSPEWTAVAGTALGLTVTVLVGWSLVRRRAPAPMSTTRPPASGLLDYLRSRAFWALLAVGMLVALATPDYLLDVLRPADVAPIPFAVRLQGDFLAKAGRLIAAVAYALACRRLAPRMLLPLALAVAALGVCALLAAGRGTSPAFELGMAANGFGQSLAAVALMDQAFRAAPRGHEALAFTLTAFAPVTVAPALRNLWFAQGLAFSTDVAIGTGGLLLAILAARLVPADLLDRPDGHRFLRGETLLDVPMGMLANARNPLVRHVWRLMSERNIYRNWYCNSGAFVAKNQPIRGYVKSYFETEDASAAITNLFAATERLVRAALKVEGAKEMAADGTLQPLLTYCVSPEQRFFNLPSFCCDMRSIYCLNSARTGAVHGLHHRDQRELRQGGWRPADPDAEYEAIVHQRLLSAHSQLCGIFQQVDPNSGKFYRRWELRDSAQCVAAGHHNREGRSPDEEEGA